MCMLLITGKMLPDMLYLKYDTFFNFDFDSECVCIGLYVSMLGVCVCLTQCRGSHIISWVCLHTRRQEPPIKNLLSSATKQKSQTPVKATFFITPFVLIERKLSSPVPGRIKAQTEWVKQRKSFSPL